MTFVSEIAGRSLRLPKPQTRRVWVVRDLRVPMDDGVELLADRWAPSRGVRRVAFRLWPTAHRFDRHHRIRVLVAGGAHPRYARNTGTEEPLATASRLVPVAHELLHDAAHPSAVTLTVVGA